MIQQFYIICRALKFSHALALGKTVCIGIQFVGGVVRSTIIDTLNALLGVEAHHLCGDGKHERAEGCLTH
jgi:hypothetical protein